MTSIRPPVLDQQAGLRHMPALRDSKGIASCDLREPLWGSPRYSLGGGVEWDVSWDIPWDTPRYPKLVTPQVLLRSPLRGPRSSPQVRGIKGLAGAPLGMSLVVSRGGGWPTPLQISEGVSDDLGRARPPVPPPAPGRTRPRDPRTMTRVERTMTHTWHTTR